MTRECAAPFLDPIYGASLDLCVGRARSSMPYHLLHAQLGAIKGSRVTEKLVQFRGLPYAQVSRRFARSSRLDHLPSAQDDKHSGYDATEYSPCSIQPLNSIDTDVRWNQLPVSSRREQHQSEDCLRLTVTCPVTVGEHAFVDLPVIVFVHGGALMIGSGIFEPVLSIHSKV